MIIKLSNRFTESQVKEIKKLFDSMFNSDLNISVYSEFITFTDN